MRQIQLVGFAGSLRHGSYNRALLRACQELLPDGMTLEALDISQIPLFDADVEAAGDPAPVAAFKAAIRQADGLLIATPEYNHGVPAVTKNAVDWASRPPDDSVLDRKPIGILGASPGLTGTARAQSALRQSFVFTNAYCMPQPEILVHRAHEKFDGDGRLVHAATRRFLERYLVALKAWVERFRD